MKLYYYCLDAVGLTLLLYLFYIKIFSCEYEDCIFSSGFNIVKRIWHIMAKLIQVNERIDG